VGPSFLNFGGLDVDVVHHYFFASLQTLQVETQRRDVLGHFVRRLFECHQNARLAELCRAANQIFHREHGLAASGSPTDDGGAPFGQAASGNLIESGDPSGRLLQLRQMARTVDLLNLRCRQETLRISRVSRVFRDHDVKSRLIIHEFSSVSMRCQRATFNSRGRYGNPCRRSREISPVFESRPSTSKSRGRSRTPAEASAASNRPENVQAPASLRIPPTSNCKENHSHETRGTIPIAGVGARLSFQAYKRSKFEGQMAYDFDQAFTEGFTFNVPAYACYTASSAPRSTSDATRFSRLLR